MSITLATRLARRKNPGLIAATKGIKPKWELKLFEDRIEWKDELHDWQSMSLVGVDATIDLVDASSRVTATRLLTVGLFALAAKKKKRIYALTITGPDGSISFPMEKVMYGDREFAKAVNQASIR